MDVQNNFAQLMKALDKASSPRATEKEAKSTAKATISLMFDDMLRAAPQGQREPIDVNGTLGDKPSIRIWGIDLATAFLNSVGDVTGAWSYVRKREVGVRAEVGIDHPSYDQHDYGIIEFLEYGTSWHTISRAEGSVLKVWLGSPLRWPVRSSLMHGLNFLDEVEHQGARPRPFVDAIMDKYGNFMQSTLVDDVIDYTFFDRIGKSAVLDRLS